MDIRKFCTKRLHVEVAASEANDADATATATDVTDVHAPGTAADSSKSKPVLSMPMDTIGIGQEQPLQV
jgi:hypothetical protein